MTSAPATFGTSLRAAAFDQALKDGVEFLLVFDSGDFSENETFLICDWFAAHAAGGPGQKLWCRQIRLRRAPDRHRAHSLHVRGKVPPSLSEDAPPPPVKQSRQSYTWHMMAQEPTKAAWRFGTHHRLAQFHRVEDDRGRPNRSRTGRDPRASLAPERRRMAVLSLRPRRMTVFASGGKSARSTTKQVTSATLFATWATTSRHRRRATGVPRLVRSDHYADHLIGPMDGCAAARVG